MVRVAFFAGSWVRSAVKRKPPALRDKRGRVFLFKNIFVFYIEYLFYENDFIGIKVPLSNFDFGDSATGNIATAKLQLCRQPVLRYARFFSQILYIFAYTFFNFCIHTK